MSREREREWEGLPERERERERESEGEKGRLITSSLPALTPLAVTRDPRLKLIPRFARARSTVRIQGESHPTIRIS